MNINDLRQIGKKLLEMVPRYRFAEDSQVALKKGASGDKTFPMDKKAEDIIFYYLEGLNEPFHIISEEHGRKNIGDGGLNILIDPIDGSKNAISGLPLFSTSIAVSDGNRIGDIFMSYVVNLVSGDEFWAEKGKGAFLNGKKIATQDSDELMVILFEAQKPARDMPGILPLLSRFRRARCMGSVALDLGYLSNGSASVFVNPFDSRSFDFGGGWLLVQEAGGVFTDLSGRPMEESEIGLDHTSPLLASANEKIHSRVLEIINEG
jgi:myo-inositol-1(or 4)-monophosphatase